MKYKLYKNGHNDTSHIMREVFYNREIKDYETYLNLTEDVLEPYTNLDNINEAVELYKKHINDNIYILVDTDPDGYCSAAMMYLYIVQDNENANIHYLLHNRAKAHGLSDVIVPDDCEFLIVPDAGTNDFEECKELQKKGIDVLILDHHKKEVENPYAVIVNNQISDNYTNKDLCGAGIVYRFLQALDDEEWNEYADDYLDLVALANISDVMDLRSFETRYLVNLGLKNIKNKCFSAFVKAQDYSINGKINPHNVSWYITPVLNACIRIGSQEDKDMLFRAFIEQDEFFEYKKRATKDKPAEIIQENIYDRITRLCKNTKARQDKLRTKCTEELIKIGEEFSEDNKVIMIDATDKLDVGLTGVVAIRIAEYFNKPCILLQKHVNDDGTIIYGGSARNVNHSPIDSFKDVVNQTTVLNGQGHNNAFGLIGLKENNKDKALIELNELLKNVDYDSTYSVDFILNSEDITIPFIYELSEFDNIVCQGFEEPMVAVENISLHRNDFEIFGKSEDTICFYINDVKYVMFKCKEGNELYDFLQNAWDENDNVEFNLVGKPTINEYNGVKTAQIILENVEVLNIGTENIDDEEDIW